MIYTASSTDLEEMRIL